MRNLRILPLMAFLLFASLHLTVAQNTADDFSKNVSKSFLRQSGLAFEKVYLQTDKPYYSAGEQIWFKGYLVSAVTHYPQSLSNFIYVELINKSDTVVQRLKIRRAPEGFSGHIKLPAETPEGNYVIRAYTYWMRNEGEDFFFKKNIYIGNAIDDEVKADITYSAPVDGKVTATVRFVNQNNYPLTGKTVAVKLTQSPNEVKKSFLTTNASGKINFQIAANDPKVRNRSISVKFDGSASKFERTFYVPSFSKDFDMQFFPESGGLLLDQSQVVAFKAIGANGLSMEVTGKIYNEKDEEIAELESIHKGMGKFLFIAESGHTYYARVKAENGTEKRFDLPKAVEHGVNIHIAQNKEKIIYQITNQTSLPLHSLYLVVHCRGMLQTIKQLDSLSLNGIFHANDLPAGIVSFSVTDSQRTQLCERIAFVQNTTAPLVNMQSNKDRYKKREKATLSFSVSDSNGKPAIGQFSLSVTDAKTVAADSLSDNICSYLLLSSDLKGYIEDPAFYFNHRSSAVKEKLDLLMLTQGWRRFNTADVLKNNIKPANYFVEAGQSLSGKVLNLVGKPSRLAELIVLSPKINNLIVAKADSMGRYLIQGLSFQDSTTFIIKAKRKKGLPGLEVIPDNESYPVVQMFIPDMRQQIKNQLDDYLNVSKTSYYTEGGMRVYNLKEVTVEADRQDNNSYPYLTPTSADYNMNEERLIQTPGLDIFNLLSTVPGVRVNGQEISIRGSHTDPLFILDGVKVFDIDQISFLTAVDIENISVYKNASSTAILGSDAAGGAISITLKKGYQQKVQVSPSLSVVHPLGYQEPSEFYVPKYDVDSIRNSHKEDLRTTIYWDPRVSTDSTGTAHVSFYTADKANNYNVILEGITRDGEICRYVGTLRREDY